MDLLELEQLIEKAAKCKSHVVNLSHRGLTIVTNNVAKLTDVRHLLLNDNKLLMAPSELSLLPLLEELMLDNNQLTMLPKEIGCLCHIRCAAFV